MPTIKVDDIAHVRFAAPDLASMRSFLDDFGLRCFESDGKLYGKAGSGRPFVHVTQPGESRFLAVGLRAGSVADLDRLATRERVPVEDLEEPGGSRVVRLTDPDRLGVEVLAGQARAEATIDFADLPRNTVAARPRLRTSVRLDPAPAHVRRIGHAVLRVRDFRASEKWYKERFGFLTSDEVEAAREVPLGAFMRCDRGEEPADHHTLFQAQLPGKPGLLHAAFEVANLDDLMLGHQHLKSKGRQAATATRPCFVHHRTATALEPAVPAPVQRPGKIFAIGLNYADHIEESKMATPERQVWFTKAQTSISGPYDAIQIARGAATNDYEVELVAIIGKGGKHIDAADASAAIFGYYIGNDVTERLWQHAGPQWTLGKSFDTHAPIGPWIVTADELEDPHDLGIRCYVNGSKRQDSSTRHLIFNVWQQLEHLSTGMTLEAGDLLFTGTPGGVGAAMNPRQFLKSGDVVRCEIDELGHIEGTMVAES